MCDADVCILVVSSNKRTWFSDLHIPAAGKYTIVGVVIDGMDVLDKMEKIKVGMPMHCNLCWVHAFSHVMLYTLLQGVLKFMQSAVHVYCKVFCTESDV